MASQRLFVLLTARPEFRAPWSNASQMMTLPLARLSRRETAAMIRGVAPDLPAAMLAQLVAKTDGVPLFIEELTKSVAESRTNVGLGAAIEIPATLQAALHSRLDRLAPIRQIIQVAALLGRVFEADLLIAVSQRDAAVVKRALHDLIEAELIYLQKDSDCESYQFKHALIRTRPSARFFATNWPNCTARSRSPWSSFAPKRSSVTQNSWRTIFRQPAIGLARSITGKRREVPPRPGLPARRRYRTFPMRLTAARDSAMCPAAPSG
jgi:hypothetical protein